MLIAVERAIESVLTLFLLGLVGFILYRRKWISQETKELLPKFIVVVILPPFLLHHITSGFERDSLLHLVRGAIVPAISIMLTYLISCVVAVVFKIDKKRRGVFGAAWGFSNTMFIGLPVNMTLFGEEAVSYVLLYYFGNTLFFWTIGNYIISRDGGQKHIRLFSVATLKQVFSPPLQAFVVGIIMVLCGISMPGFIQEALDSIGSMTTPLALMFIGMTLAAMNFQNLKIDRDVILVLIGRFIVSPLTMLLTIAFIDLPPLMTKVFIIQSMLPVGAMIAVMPSYFNADAEYGSVLVSLSALLSMIVLPLGMVLVSLL